MNTHQNIKKVRLSGYKSIKQLSCEFNPGLNIIIGDNGSGKSNFFEFIENCFFQNYEMMGDFSAEIDMIGGHRTSNKLHSLTWKSEFIESKDNIRKSKERVVTNVEDYLDAEPGLAISYIHFKIPVGISVLGKELNVKYSVGKHEFNGESTLNLVPQYLWFALMDLFPTMVLSKLEELNEVIFSQLNDFFNKISESFRKNVIRFSPVEDIRLSNAFRIAKISSDTYELRNIVLEYMVNGDWFSWDALSDGTKRVIYIISETVGEADLHSIGVPEVDDLIILLEEPEIGVHPHQLHLLIQYLRERSEFSQIFITTHSPQVLDMLSGEELDKIIIAEISQIEGTIFRHLTKEENKKARLFLKDEGLLSDYWRFSDFQRTE